MTNKLSASSLPTLLTSLAVVTALGCSGGIDAPTGGARGNTVPTAPGAGPANPANPNTGAVADPNDPNATVDPNSPGAVSDPTSPVADPNQPAVGDPTVNDPDPTIDVSSDPALAEPAPAESAGPLVVRRLSPREYSNTLNDLLGDTSDPGAELPDEGVRANGFSVVESASTSSVQTFMDTAERLVAEGRINIPCTPMAGNEQACATQFIQDFGRRAFRRPVLQTELDNLLSLFDRARELEFSFDESLGHVASAMLQSSGFLYLWEIGDTAPVAEGDLVQLTPYQLASRLSYLLWGSMPDDTLSAAADAGQLTTPEQLAAQADRLLSDPARVSGTMTDFHLQWLHIENLDDLQRDPTLYPDFTVDIRESYETELSQFVSNVVLEGDGTLRSLLTAPYTFANSALSGVYGVSAPGAGFSQVTLDSTQRAGVLTQGAFLAASSNTTGSNPPRRGSVIWKQLFCGTMPAVPADVPAVEPPSDDLTTRQRFEVHSQNPCASGCHGVLDPLGFAFENYDAVGAYRSDENGMPIDASGSLVTPDGGVINFENAVDLVTALSTSYEVERCVARNWFRYMLGRLETTADEGSLEAAYRASGAGTAADFSVKTFIRQMVQSAAFRLRQPQAGEPL